MRKKIFPMKWPTTQQGITVHEGGMKYEKVHVHSGELKCRLQPSSNTMASDARSVKWKHSSSIYTLS